MSSNDIEAPVKKKRGGQPGNKGGRPPILILNDDTIKKISGLGKIQVTTEEAAAVMGVTRGAFEQFLSKHEKAREAFENGKQEGKAALRRLQMHSAQNGNVTMLIWLGKQFLGQRDKTDQELTIRNVSELTDDELARIAAGSSSRVTAPQKGEE